MGGERSTYSFGHWLKMWLVCNLPRASIVAVSLTCSLMRMPYVLLPCLRIPLAVLFIVHDQCLHLSRNMLIHHVALSTWQVDRAIIKQCQQLSNHHIQGSVSTHRHELGVYKLSSAVLIIINNWHKVAISAHYHKSAPILIWPQMLPGRKTPTTNQLIQICYGFWKLIRDSGHQWVVVIPN